MRYDYHTVALSLRLISYVCHLQSHACTLTLWIPETLDFFLILSLSTLSLSVWMLHVIVLFHCAHYIQVVQHVSKYCFMFAVVVSAIYGGIIIHWHSSDKL